ILSGGYNTVKNISEGNFNLHRVFLDGLMEVSPTVRGYRRVADIADYQLTLVREYRNAYNRFKRDGNFNPEELAYLGRVYDKLFRESLRNLDELLTVVTAGKARMSDDERLQAIDRIYLDMQDKLMFLRHFNNNTTVLAVQRAKEKNDARTMRRVYGTNRENGILAKCVMAAVIAAVCLGLPFLGHAQDIAGEMKGMHGVLESLYNQMMPLCGQLIGVGRGLAGFAAMWYIASRVWGHLSRAEPIDFYPLFRPFAIGFCVLMFPSVLGIIGGVMKPTVTATSAMVEGSDRAITVLLQR